MTRQTTPEFADLRGAVRSSSSAVRCQAVSVAMHRVDEGWLVRVSLDFLSEACNRVIDGSCDRRVGIVPDTAQELGSRNDAALALDEVPENLELAMREMNRLSTACRAQLAEIDRDLP